ncbi:TonB family protein [Leclercia pneumoniae]|uniref:energy transducer TonB family protein n=1 Tax=Leclercia pneumoniae TaxID=2815358 RepID=UPI0030CAE17A
MNAQITDLPRASWLRSGAASVLFHFALALPFLLHFTLEQDAPMPAAVMMEQSTEFEVSLIHPDSPPGISQQRSLEAMSEQETARQKEAPVLPERDDAEVKLAAASPNPESRKKREIKKKAQREQKEEKGNASMTSLAAPPVQTVQTQRTAAPLDTDSAHISQRKIGWESLVKGKINKMRNYPQDARRRKRSGTAVIMFRVNERGDVLSSQLVSSSGTLSLDRAALMALEKASPLPPPPKEIVKSGMQIVTLPVEFGLTNI